MLLVLARARFAQMLFFALLEHLTSSFVILLAAEYLREGGEESEGGQQIEGKGMQSNATSL